MDYLEYKIGEPRLILIIGDITKQVTYAIVNAANKDLSPGGGVSGAIHKVAGPLFGKNVKSLEDALQVKLNSQKAIICRLNSLSTL